MEAPLFAPMIPCSFVVVHASEALPGGTPFSRSRSKAGLWVLYFLPFPVSLSRFATPSFLPRTERDEVF